MDPENQTVNRHIFRSVFNRIGSAYRKYINYVNPRKTLTVFLSLFVSLITLLVTVQVINQRTLYRSRANDNQIMPIILPGSFLDTGIRAEDFTDVDRNSWSWKYIQQIAPLDIIVPPPATPTEFNPQGLVTRTNMAEFLLKTYVLLTGKTAPVVETPFEDIASLSAQLQDTIAKIYGLKITAGTSATTFSPNDPVNRAQMVTFFMNLYRAISGDYPPETEVPFTDIYDPDLEWSVKYIKKAYNLKVTAGTSETTFSPRDNVTREQMATFIFNFMKLFGPSRKNPNLSLELANIHSATYYPSPLSAQELNQWLPEIKATGFNALWLVNSWKDFNPRPLATPPVYNDASFLRLTNSLDLLRQNNMKAILPLNYIGPAPEGIDACRWTIDLTMYQAFETYVQEFLRRIEPYSDLVYILFFTEGAEPCNLNTYGNSNAKQTASILRPTLGSLPQRLDPQLRSRFKIGYHDYSLINMNWAGGESPIQMPLSYDFLSFATYDQEAKTDQEITETLNSHLDNFKKLYPFTPIIVGEFGALSCNETGQNSRENQARVLKTGVGHLLTQNLGFNIWQWQGRYYHNGDTCIEDPSTHSKTPDSLGLVYRDNYQQFVSPTVSKPARVEIMKLLNPSAPLPQCREQDTPTFAQKIVDEHHKYCHSFSSQCVPEGWSIIEGITDCSQACTGELVWVRNPMLWDGLCADENPFPSDCIPINEGRPEAQYQIDDTCRPSPSPAPSLSPISTFPPEIIPVLPQGSASPSPSLLHPPSQTPEIQVIQILPPTQSSPITTSAPLLETAPPPMGIFDTIKNFYSSVVDFVTGLLNP